MRDRFGQTIAIKCYISSFVTTLRGDCFSCCYPQVVIRRRPLFYTVNLLLPSIFLMVMDIVGFYLPPDSGERVSFKITLLLGYSVFLIIVSDTLPATAIGTPLIGKWSILSKKHGWNTRAVWSSMAEWKISVVNHESYINYERYKTFRTFLCQGLHKNKNYSVINIKCEMSSCMNQNSNCFWFIWTWWCCVIVRGVHVC